MGSVVLPHLNTAWHVDQAILSEDERLVVIRFGRDGDPDCMKMDEVLFKIADKVKNFAVVYVCDIDQVPDFNQMYELYDPMTVMFFFRNKHIMCDFGTEGTWSCRQPKGLLHKIPLLIEAVAQY
ncbi:U4/U6-U5 snRNP complex subunit dib1 [Pyricularia oryzae]